MENLETFFLNNPDVLPDHQHVGKKALLVHAGDDTSKGKHYVAAVEVEAKGNYLDIVSMMTMPRRTLHKAEELKQSWPEGQRLPVGNSPHHVAPCGAHAEADSTDVQPTLE